MEKMAQSRSTLRLRIKHGLLTEPVSVGQSALKYNSFILKGGNLL
jgi:hypothetical protein